MLFASWKKTKESKEDIIEAVTESLRSAYRGAEYGQKAERNAIEFNEKTGDFYTVREVVDEVFDSRLEVTKMLLPMNWETKIKI